QRSQPPRRLVAPHLPAQPGRVQPSLAYPGADEHVDYRVAVAELDDLVAIAVVEQAQRRRPPRLGAQHTSSVSAQEPGGLQPTRYRAQQVTAFGRPRWGAAPPGRPRSPVRACWAAPPSPGNG